MAKQLLFRKTLVHARDVRSFAVEASSSGWQVSERDGDRFVQLQRFTDWHRVERKMTHFLRDISHLRNQGWIEA